MNVGNYAVGSSWQLMMTQLGKETGAQFNIIPYWGTGQMLPDLMSGVVEVGCGSMAGMNPGIHAGAIRPILLIYGRSYLLPELPSWKDEGFTGPELNGFVGRVWPAFRSMTRELNIPPS